MMEEKNAEFRPRLKSKFSMGELDFIRYDMLLKNLDTIAFNARHSPECEKLLMPWYSALYELYLNFRPILYETSKQELDINFRSLRSAIDTELFRINHNKSDMGRVWAKSSATSVSYYLIDKMDKVQMKLMEIKQICGLGISVKKEFSEKRLIKENLE